MSATATKELLVNVVLAFVAGAVTSAGTALEAFDVPPTKAVLFSIAGGALYAGVRGAVGYLKLRYGKPVSVDV